MSDELEHAVDKLLEQESEGAYSALLRKAIKDRGLSFVELERQTGLKRQSLVKFYRGEQSLRLDLADKLATFLGITPEFPDE